MELYRSERARKPKMIWKQKDAPSEASDPRISKKVFCMIEKIALKPMATGPLPAHINLDHSNLPELPDHIPLFELQFEHSKLFITPTTELQGFSTLSYI